VPSRHPPLSGRPWTGRATTRLPVAAALVGTALLALTGSCSPVPGPVGAPATAVPDDPVTAGDGDADEPAQATTPTPVRGGTLRVATTGVPPHLDPHRSTDTLVLLITGHLYETLFTSDAQHRPVPLLAAGHEVSDDGLVHTIALRRGVRFHDGTPLTATDVVASLERWASMSGLGASLLAATAELTAVNDHTIGFRLTEPYGTLPIALSRQLQAATIHPAHVLARSDRTRLAAPVGTGPYRLDQWEGGRPVRLVRFDGYRPPPGPRDGYAGASPRYLDAIEFVAMPNEAARVAALRAGDVHLLESVSPDQLPVLARDPEVRAELVPADVWLNLVLNLRSPALARVEVRRAVQHALDHDAILQAAVGPDAYTLGPDLLPGTADWSSAAGADRYHPNDPELARRLLVEQDALGTRLRLLTTQEQPVEHNAALVIAQQLRAVGFEVELEVVDGATLSSWRADEHRYELYLASASFRPDPVMRNLTAAASGWWEDPVKEALLDRLRASDDLVERQDLWSQVQARFHEDVPRIKLGDLSRVVAHRRELHGLGPTELQPDLSVAWLAP
jgi:peptide/nickel transport system substrate-binding protein